VIDAELAPETVLRSLLVLPVSSSTRGHFEFDALDLGRRRVDFRVAASCSIYPPCIARSGVPTIDSEPAATDGETRIMLLVLDVVPGLRSLALMNRPIRHY
jgi:hypothetical protein